MMKKLLIAAVLFMLLTCFAVNAGADEKGAFRVDHFQGGAMGITFIDITVNEGSDLISLWTNCTVTDVKLEKLMWSGTWISGTEVLFTAEALASNQVLNIAVDTPDVLPVLRVTALNEQGQGEYWYITRDGRDNAPVLLAPDAFPDAENPFSAIAGLPFSFCSGAGAWETVITFSPDGCFSGSFHDSDMGDDGEGYPFGTRYFSNFTGTVAAAEQSPSRYTELRLVSLRCTDPEQEAFIDDGVLYIPSGPYGLENADTLLLYPPETPLSALPEGFLPWAQLWGRNDDETAVLGKWGLYNIAEEYGFVSPDTGVFPAE